MSSRSERLTVIANRQKALNVEYIDVEEERDLDDTPENQRALSEAERRLTALAAERSAKADNRNYAAIRDHVVDLLDPQTILALSTTTATVEDTQEIRMLRLQAPKARVQRRAAKWGVTNVDDLLPNLEDAILSRQRAEHATSQGTAFLMQCFDVQTHYAVGRNAIDTVYRIFGRLANGSDVCLDVTGVPSYFYMLVPEERERRWNRGAVETLRDDMNKALAYRLKPNAYMGCRRHGCRCAFAKPPEKDSGFAPRFEPCVKAIESKVGRIVKQCSIVRGRSIIGFHPQEQTFIRIEVEHPFLMSHCTWWIRKQAKERDSICYGCQLHEAHIKPVVRFLVDQNIVGCGWIDVRNANIRRFTAQQSRCALECTVDVGDITSQPEETANTPFRVLALDIECMSINVNVFPTANKCPVIQMSTMGRIYGQPERDEKIVFCLGHQANNTRDNPEAWKTDNTTDGGTIIDCPNETALFLAIYQYVLDFNPDIITGEYRVAACKSTRRTSPRSLPAPLTPRPSFALQDTTRTSTWRVRFLRSQRGEGRSPRFRLPFFRSF